MCVCGAKSTATLGSFVIKTSYSEVRKESLSFAMRALDLALWVGGSFKPTLAK